MLAQSVLREYLEGDGSHRLDDAVAAAGARASGTAPLAWIQLESINRQRRHGLSVTLWPGGKSRELTTANAFGGDVRHPAAATA